MSEHSTSNLHTNNPLRLVDSGGTSSGTGTPAPYVRPSFLPPRRDWNAPRERKSYPLRRFRVYEVLPVGTRRLLHTYHEHADAEQLAAHCQRHMPFNLYEVEDAEVSGAPFDDDTPHPSSPAARALEAERAQKETAL